MFRLFFGKKKTEIEKLEEKYAALKEEAYKLSHTDRAASSKKSLEAEELMNKIQELARKSS